MLENHYFVGHLHISKMGSKIEISPDGSLLVYKKGYSKEFIIKTIKEKGLWGLRIFAVLNEDRLSDIGFLKDYGFLEALGVTSVNDLDFSSLSALDRLRELTIDVQGTNKIDLRNQVNLGSLGLGWRKNIRGIECCKNLKELVVWDYKEPDLLPLQTLDNLEKLEVKTGSIKNLKGLKDLGSLRLIRLGNCRSLKSISDLNGLKNLRLIEIESCTKIQDYESLTDLPALEELRIINSKGIRSIRFIKNFPALKTLCLSGNTNVLDGDMMPASQVGDVISSHRRHYNLKIENSRVDAIIKQNMEFLKRHRK
jgi:hypothetical protein